MEAQAATAPDLETLLHAASTIFGALGRSLLCLDRDMRIVHASAELDHVLGPGGAAALMDRPVEEVLGPELFGPDANLRRALEAGERREGWGATLQAGTLGPRRVSISAAPIPPDPTGRCDPLVSYAVMLRPAEEAEPAASGEPTVFAGIVARSGPMLRIFRLIEDLEESEATVLLAGESGTGKELVARALHLHSPRRRGPFVAVNCGALPGEYAVAVCRGQTIHAEDLPSEVCEALPAPPPADEPEAAAPGSASPLRDVERERLRAVLEAHHWRRDEAAKALGTSRTTLWRKMRELDLMQ